MSRIFVQEFGKTASGEPVTLYTLKNNAGSQVGIMDYGATVVSVVVPDKEGNFEDIALGFDSFERYPEDSPYFGSTVGRVANRICGGKFSLNGTDYTLAQNNGPNCLHGGEKGFDKVIWAAQTSVDGDVPTITFTYKSADGEEGFPGNLDVEVVYTFTNDNELQIQMTAQTDAPTPVNLTNHTYFNLASQGRGDILSHKMQIFADGFNPVDDVQIPTGEIYPVVDSAMDFNIPCQIGARIADAQDGGYDHNFVLAKKSGEYAMAARVVEEQSGRVLEAWTNQPGIQFYSGNFLDGFAGKTGATYPKHSGFCLEPQKFPDAVNQSQFESCILKPGETYSHKMAYVFKTE